jgi:hypothetical protein
VTTSDTQELVEIKLIGVPLGLLTRAQERGDELGREFMHIADSDSTAAPARLMALSQQLRGRYAGYMEPVQATIDAAIARGDESVDVVFSVPSDVGAAASRLWALLDEADEYCRAGDLLTLETPPEMVQLRHWYLSQFIDQASGAEPVSWATYAEPAPA